MAQQGKPCPLPRHTGQLSHLQTATRTVLSHDADVGGVNAGPDEPGQVVELNIPHLWGSECGPVERRPLPVSSCLAVPAAEASTLHKTPRAVSPAPPSTYVLELKEHLPRQLNPFLIDMFNGHHVSLEGKRRAGEGRELSGPPTQLGLGRGTEGAHLEESCVGKDLVLPMGRHEGAITGAALERSQGRESQPTEA